VPEARKLQRWVTIRGPASETIIQDEDEWLDLEEHDDVAIWVQVPDASNVDSLQFQTSPVRDGDTFVTMATWMVGGAALEPEIASVVFASATTPLARYLRWACRARAGGSMSITFRAWVVASQRCGPQLVAMLAPSGEDFMGMEDDTGPAEENRLEEGAVDEEDERAWREWRPPLFATPDPRAEMRAAPPRPDLSTSRADGEVVRTQRKGS
jgi:hypothetical protein